MREELGSTGIGIRMSYDSASDGNSIAKRKEIVLDCNWAEHFHSGWLDLNYL